MVLRAIVAGLGGWGGMTPEDRANAWKFMLTALEVSSRSFAARSRLKAEGREFYSRGTV